ncbi:MAG: hypothetical protein AAB289_06900, partial [Chloroflexota bacterium]
LMGVNHADQHHTAVAGHGGLGLVALAVVSSLISLYYYLRVVRQIYIAEPVDTGRLAVPRVVGTALVALLVLVALAGVYPYPLAAIINVAVLPLGLPG